jgi:hypothetical protein
MRIPMTAGGPVVLHVFTTAWRAGGPPIYVPNQVHFQGQLKLARDMQIPRVAQAFLDLSYRERPASDAAQVG